MSSTNSELVGSPINHRRGARITLHTCLLLALILIITFSLSIGVSFRSHSHCFAGTCGEWLFPLQARVHVAIWYLWLSLSVTFLGVRAFHPEIQKYLARPLSSRKLPLIGKQLSLGGCLLMLWIMVLYGVIISNWWIRLNDYFVDRGEAGGIFSGGERLAAVALTGHMCDVTMGVVLLPISRHGALATAFNFSVSTTLTVHMLMAYLLFILVSTHGLLYLSWVPLFNSLSAELRMIIPILNPTYLYNETWPGNKTSLGVWRASLIFTGGLTAVIMLGIFVTTLPRIRSKHFNLFYFTHLMSTVMIVIICLHASTMFYCLAPGLAMWCLDWGIRLHELRTVLDGEITTVGNEWYCVSIPLPRSRLSGLPYQSPLAHFYIHHAVSSILELHPFTTITHLKSTDLATPAVDNYFMVQFLFRKRGRTSPFIAEESSPSKFSRLWSRGSDSKEEEAKSGQWTERLAALVDQEPSPVRRGSVATVMSVLFPRINVTLRLEGPYFSPAEPSRYDKVICFVAGTGISGAIAIATAFSELNRTPSTEKPNESPPNNSPVCPWRRCIVIWSVRATDFVDLPFFEYREGLEVRHCITGPGRQRMDFNETLGEILTEDPHGKTWVYISGPKPFIDAGKSACKGRDGVDLYAASWDI